MANQSLTFSDVYIPFSTRWPMVLGDSCSSTGLIASGEGGGTCVCVCVCAYLCVCACVCACACVYLSFSNSTLLAQVHSPAFSVNFHKVQSVNIVN